MIRVAFASNDRSHVNLHFGAAESFIVYDIAPGAAELVGIGEFVRAEMKGENKDRGLPRGEAPSTAARADPDLAVPEDKVIAKLDFLRNCSAVYAASIGTSSIKRLMAAEIQPIIVDNGHEITDLLNEVSLALVHGGLSWVERAAAKAQRNETRATGKPSLRLITSIEELE
jgi:nitrogen fixation protein NifX